MKIEALSRVENVPGKFAVYFDDGWKIVVSAVQIADFGLYAGRELTEDEYTKLCRALELSSSKARALRILGSRNLSAHEMERRLLSKGESQETARETVRWLKDIGVVNDAEYAQTIARHYCAKGYGMARIRDELYRRGIPREMWDDALSCLDNMEEAAYNFIMTKLKGRRDKADLRRATDALCRRGFSYEEAHAAVSLYLENVEENEEAEH